MPPDIHGFFRCLEALFYIFAFIAGNNSSVCSRVRSRADMTFFYDKNYCMAIRFIDRYDLFNWFDFCVLQA